LQATREFGEVNQSRARDCIWWAKVIYHWSLKKVGKVLMRWTMSQETG